MHDYEACFLRAPIVGASIAMMSLQAPPRGEGCRSREAPETLHTAWHSHEGGQTLYAIEGRGLVQSRGKKVVEIRPGDVVYTPDGEEHSHGATPEHFMTHLSIAEGPPSWGDHVSDAEYQQPR